MFKGNSSNSLDIIWWMISRNECSFRADAVEETMIIFRYSELKVLGEHVIYLEEWHVKRMSMVGVIIGILRFRERGKMVLLFLEVECIMMVDFLFILTRNKGGLLLLYQVICSLKPLFLRIYFSSHYLDVRLTFYRLRVFLLVLLQVTILNHKALNNQVEVTLLLVLRTYLLKKLCD